MSADDAIYVQKNNAGEFCFQHDFLSADEPPNPETATDKERFKTLEDGFYTLLYEADATEYGFRVMQNARRGPATERMDIFATSFSEDDDPDNDPMRQKFTDEGRL